MSKKNINVIFIIQKDERGQKDIDHYLPFFYFLSKSETHNYTVKGLILDNKTNFSKNIDKRFNFLSDLTSIETDFLFEANFLDIIKKFEIYQYDLKITELFKKITNRIFKILKKLKKKNIDWKKSLGKNFLESKFPLIVTTSGNSTALKIISQIKKQNKKAKWIVLAHGTALCDNSMVIDSNLDKKEVSETKYNEVYHEIDYHLVTSKRDKYNLLSRGLKKDKAIVVGSPRYCKEWKQIKSNLKIDGEDVEKNNKYKVKALFLIPKKHINIFTEELTRTIDFISSYQEIELILLRYDFTYPKLPHHIRDRNNIKQFLISQKYSSSKLIEWADIVFHAGTGVIFDSFIREKITVLPRYLTCNTLISENYKAGFNLKNRDELRTLCNNAVESLDKLKNDYKKKCNIANQKFIDDFVSANGESVSSNIDKSVSFIIDNFEI